LWIPREDLEFNVRTTLKGYDNEFFPVVKAMWKERGGECDVVIKMVWNRLLFCLI
jgi:hypothetical protein